MARRKSKAQPAEDRGFSPMPPLDPTMGAFTVQPTVPTTDPPKATEQGSEWTEASQPSNPAATTDDATEPEAATTREDNVKGDSSDVSPPAAARDGPPRTRESQAAASGRWAREGRRTEVELFRDEVRKACLRAGMTRAVANEHAWDEAIAKFPPLKPVIPAPQPQDSPVETPSEPTVAGVYLVPEMWPSLPDNASLQADLGWVQSQRLAIVEEAGSRTIVHLERASCPAPSKSALAWLETSIRSYAKYVDVVSKVLAGAADEQDTVRRERLALDEIRALLDEMHKA